MKGLRAGDLVLEPLESRHAEAMFDVLGDPELYRYLDYPPPPSVEHLRKVYARLEGRKSPDGADHWLNWVVVPAWAGPIGYVQSTVMQDGTAWIAYVFARSRGGRGLATQATRTVLEHVAEAYAARRFLASVECANVRSIRLLERLDFRLATPGESKDHDLTATERLYVRYPSAS